MGRVSCGRCGGEAVFREPKGPYVIEHSESCSGRDLRRLCACGCGESIDHMRSNALYVVDSHRTRKWKQDRGYVDPRRPQPVRNGSRRRAGVGRKPQLRISYLKAVAALERAMEDPAFYEYDRLRSPRERAEDLLRPLLPPSARGLA